MPPVAAAVALPKLDDFQKQVEVVGRTFTSLRTVRAPGITIPAGIRKNMSAFVKVQQWWAAHSQLYLALTEATAPAKPVAQKRGKSMGASS